FRVAAAVAEKAHEAEQEPKARQRVPRTAGKDCKYAVLAGSLCFVPFVPLVLLWLLGGRMTKSLAIVGARGHTGAELIKFVARHPALELACVSSRELAGQPVSAHVPEFAGALRYENLDAAAVAEGRFDAVVLALPNDKAAPYVAAIDTQSPQSVIVDLSAD